MSELRYPNESPEYRKARDELLEDEKALVEKVKSVAEKRRQLPPGGHLLEPDGFYARRSSGSSNAATEFQIRVSGKTLLE